jgi:hypothetical protein
MSSVGLVASLVLMPAALNSKPSWLTHCYHRLPSALQGGILGSQDIIIAIIFAETQGVFFAGDAGHCPQEIWYESQEISFTIHA